VFTGESRGVYDVLWLNFECIFHDFALLSLGQFTKVVQIRHLLRRRLLSLYCTNCSLDPSCSSVHVVTLSLPLGVHDTCSHGRRGRKSTSPNRSVLVIEPRDPIVQKCFPVSSRRHSVRSCHASFCRSQLQFLWVHRHLKIH